MNSAKFFAEWITKRLFPISIVIFVLIYIWWFRLTPWNPQEYCCSNINYRLGIILLAFYAVAGMFWWFIKNRGCFETFFRATTIFFFTINSLYVAEFMPRVVDSAKYNGTQYYLVSYSNWPEHNPWDFYRLTKWSGFFNYEVGDHINDWAWKGKLFYDKKTNLVNVVAVFDDGNYLLYTDDKPPRSYERNSVQLGNHQYYISSQCISQSEFACNTYIHVIYECELDNSACTMLPFRYTGEEYYAFLEINEKINNEIDLYVSPIQGPDILVYSYDKHQRCYVEECEILKDAK